MAGLSQGCDEGQGVPLAPLVSEAYTVHMYVVVYVSMSRPGGVDVMMQQEVTRVYRH